MIIDEVNKAFETSAGTNCLIRDPNRARAVLLDALFSILGESGAGLDESRRFWGGKAKEFNLKRGMYYFQCLLWKLILRRFPKKQHIFEYRNTDGSPAKPYTIEMEYRELIFDFYGWDNDHHQKSRVIFGDILKQIYFFMVEGRSIRYEFIRSCKRLGGTGDRPLQAGDFFFDLFSSKGWRTLFIKEEDLDEFIKIADDFSMAFWANNF